MATATKMAVLNQGIAEVVNKSLVKRGLPAANALVSDTKRTKQMQKMGVVNYVKKFAELNELTLSKAVDTLLAQANLKKNVHVVMFCGRNGKLASRASILSWISKAKNGGEALIPAHKGSVMNHAPWHGEALKRYQLPTQPDCGAIAFYLHSIGFTDVTTCEVNAYIKKLPISLTKNSRKRVGTHHYNQNVGNYVSRDLSDLPVGHTYLSDGHMCDVFIAHPSNGRHYRAELIIWMDWRSGYIAGWGLSRVEESKFTQDTLAQTIHTHQHVPSNLYLDLGPGYNNKVVTEGPASFCSTMSIDYDFALVGNAKGKGKVEVWFKHFENRLGRQFPTHISNRRSDDLIRRIESNIKKGKLELPTENQYRDGIQNYIDWYNTQPHEEENCLRSEMWATLEKRPPYMDFSDMVRPRYERISRRGRICFEKSIYQAQELLFVDNQKVLVAADWDSNRQFVKIYDKDGRFICQATQVERQPGMSHSRAQEKDQKAIRGVIKRKQEQARILEQQIHRPLEAKANVIDMDLLTTQTKLPTPPEQDPSAEEIDISLLY